MKSPKTSAAELWTLNYRLLMSVMEEVAPAVRELGLEMKEAFLLRELDGHPNPADLARALITPKPTITFMVKRMEAAGYVQRDLDPGDLRRFRLTLTPSGREVMEASRKLLDRAFEARLDRLTATQRAELQRFLSTLG
jgi:DNA-binding MarR family transcriptional regulator